MSLPSPSPTPLNTTEFENLRGTLVATYNAQTTAHAAIIVALLVGVAAVLYSVDFRTFFEDYGRWGRSILFYFPLSLLFSGILYIFCKFYFWATMSSVVLQVPISQVQTLLANNASNPGFTKIWAIHTAAATRFETSQWSFLYSIQF